MRYIGLIRFAFLKDHSGCFAENRLEGGKYGGRNIRGHSNYKGDVSLKQGLVGDLERSQWI
jgi:hypothetical protein